MALIKCPECKKQVSEHAAFCPHCGCPSTLFKKTKQPPKPKNVAKPKTKDVKKAPSFYSSLPEQLKELTKNITALLKEESCPYVFYSDDKIVGLRFESDLPLFYYISSENGSYSIHLKFENNSKKKFDWKSFNSSAIVEKIIHELKTTLNKYSNVLNNDKDEENQIIENERKLGEYTENSAFLKEKGHRVAYTADMIIHDLKLRFNFDYEIKNEAIYFTSPYDTKKGIQAYWFKVEFVKSKFDGGYCAILNYKFSPQDKNISQFFSMESKGDYKIKGFNSFIEKIVKNRIVTIYLMSNSLYGNILKVAHGGRPNFSINLKYNGVKLNIPQSCDFDYFDAVELYMDWKRDVIISILESNKNFSNCIFDSTAFRKSLYFNGRTNEISLAGLQGVISEASFCFDEVMNDINEFLDDYCFNYDLEKIKTDEEILEIQSKKLG